MSVQKLKKKLLAQADIKSNGRNFDKKLDRKNFARLWLFNYKIVTADNLELYFLVEYDS